MTWLLALAVLWPVLSVVAALVIGRAVRLRDRMEPAPGHTSRGNFAVDVVPLPR